MICASPTTLNNALEVGFVRDVIFQNKPFSTGLDIIKNERIIIYLELNEIDMKFIALAKKEGKKIILYHMGDEQGKNLGLYPHFDFVIRNYFIKDFNYIESTKVMWSPNGYKTGLGLRSHLFIKPSCRRKSFASFLGWLDNPKSFNDERFIFRRVAQKIPNLLYVNDTEGFAKGYNLGLYAAMMEDSIFGPCPAGNSPETIRLYDALELGTIPITLKHEFICSKFALGEIGPPPFPQLDGWNQLPDYLSQMQNLANLNFNEIQKIQDECLSWWQTYKIHISHKVATRISNLI